MTDQFPNKNQQIPLPKTSGVMNPYAEFGFFSFTAPLILVNFTADPAIAELGETVSSVVLRWAFNRDQDNATLDGTPVSPIEEVRSIQGPFTQDTSWAMRGTAGEYSAQGKTKLSFLNKGYWGVSESIPTDSSDILALQNSSFVTTKSKVQIGYNCTGNQRPVFCLPSRIGTGKVLYGQHGQMPGVIDWVQWTDIEKSSVAFTNSRGYTEDYTVMVFGSLPQQGYFEVRWL